MGSVILRNLGRSVPAALLLSLLIAGQSLAATWSAPVALSTGGTSYARGLVGLNSSTAVALYMEDSLDWSIPHKIYVRRTTNSGASWAPAQLISEGSRAAIAGRGSRVDVIWTAPNGRLRYARSTNEGVSFGSSVALSPSGRFATDISVARGPNGRVAVAWLDLESNAVRVRVSTDGGASFGRAKTLSTSGYDAGTAVAIGSGVVYVAYFVDHSKLRVKRSRDDGASWSSAAKITGSATWEGVSMTAAGRYAYVAYTAQNMWPNFAQARYRRTTDKGATWSKQRDLAPASWTTSNPQIALSGGVLRAAFERCDPEWDICSSFRVLYRQSTDGKNWTTAQRVSPKNVWDAWSPSVAFAGKILVAYTGEKDEGISPYVRSGTP